MDRQAFGKRLNAARKECDVTSDKLAELCQVNPVHIRHIESGSRLPSLPMLINICNALHVSPNYLLRDSLEENEADTQIKLSDKLLNLTPKQLSAANDMIDTLIAHLD